MRSLVVVLCLVSAILTGCTSMAAPPTLDGSTWQLSGWSDSASNPNGFGITAHFANGQMTGKSGVNSYFGPYSSGPGDTFTFGPGGSTRMAGPPEAMQAEQTFFELLEQVRTYRRSGNELTLADADNKMLLTFRVAAPAEAIR